MTKQLNEKLDDVPVPGDRRFRLLMPLLRRRPVPLHRRRRRVLLHPFTPFDTRQIRKLVELGAHNALLTERRERSHVHVAEGIGVYPLCDLFTLVIPSAHQHHRIDERARSTLRLRVHDATAGLLRR